MKQLIGNAISFNTYTGSGLIEPIPIITYLSGSKSYQSVKQSQIFLQNLNLIASLHSSEYKNSIIVELLILKLADLSYNLEGHQT